jgi:hypothetical protein
MTFMVSSGFLRAGLKRTRSRASNGRRLFGHETLPAAFAWVKTVFALLTVLEVE